MRDVDGYRQILAALTTCGAFERVLFGPVPSPPLTEASAPYAWVLPSEWEEQGETDPEVPVRRVGFRIVLGARDPDPLRAFDLCDQLAQVVSNGLTGQILPGPTGDTENIPALSRISRGVYSSDLAGPPRSDECRCVLVGEWVYLVDAPTAHDETFMLEGP